jgi:hypothetical protein
MPRRNNPITTLLLFLGVCAFGWASYEYIYVQGIFRSKEAPPPPPDQVEGLKRQIEDALAGDACFLQIAAVNWRPHDAQYRVDVNMLEGCDKQTAQRMAARVSDLIGRGSGGKKSQVWMYQLGREVYHLLP